MSMQNNIERAITQNLEPVHLEVLNESHRHSVAPGSETHFKVVVVSPRFEGLGWVQRHQSVNQALKDEFARGLHALSLQTYTPAEWENRNHRVDDSPPCLGGSKVDEKSL